jgi:hypothetical protein
MWDIAFVEENRSGLLESSLGYVPLMVHLLETVTDEPVSIEKLSGGLWCISATVSLRTYLGSPDLRLVPALIRATAYSETCKKNITNILMNISLERTIHSYLLRQDFGYMEYLKREVTAASNNPIYYNSFQCLFTDIELNHLRVALDLGVHEFFLQKLMSKGNVPSQWDEVGKRCLNILMYISRFEYGARAICKLRDSEFLYLLLKDTTIQGMKAAFLIANCFGRLEANSSRKPLLEDKPTILPLIRECLDVTLDYDPAATKVKDMEAKGFVMGVIQINTIASALRNLSLCDKNKAIIVQDKALLRNICLCLEAFINKAPQFGGVYNNMWRPAGGGGEDYFSASDLIELLLQLSFYFEDDDALLSFFDEVGEYRLSSLVSVLLTIEDLPIEAHHMAAILYRRYFPNGEIAPMEVVPDPACFKVPPPAEEVPLQPPKHIIVSYSPVMRPDLVHSLLSSLKAAGYDVWTEQEGSIIADPLSSSAGSRSQFWEKAVDLAEVVVVCVSRPYKASAQYRLDGKYIHQQQELRGLKVRYLMLDEHYTTRSEEIVDGWLGYLIGTSSWQPFWDIDRHSARAVKFIVDAVDADLAEQQNNRAWVERQTRLKQQDQPHQKPDSSPLTSASPTISWESHHNHHSRIPLEACAVAWSLVQQQRKAKYPGALRGLLEDLGVEKAADLSLLDEHECLLLSSLLRAPQQRSFIEALALDLSLLDNRPTHFHLTGVLSTAMHAAWILLDNKRSRYPAGFLGIKDDFGVERAEDLSALDAPELALIAQFLKKPQQQSFLSSLGISL